MNDRLKRIKILGIIGIIYSLFLVIDNIIQGIEIYQIILAAFLLLFSIFFIICSKRLAKNKK